MSDQRAPHIVPGLETRDPSRSSGYLTGPLLLLVPVVSAIAIVVWMRPPGAHLVPSRPPERLDPETTHDVLGGEMLLQGATLVYWLAPSEPDETRQAFQTKALRKRYGLSDGAPWRLRLEWLPFEATRYLGLAGGVEDDRLVPTFVELVGEEIVAQRAVVLIVPPGDELVLDRQRAAEISRARDADDRHHLRPALFGRAAYRDDCFTGRNAVPRH